MVNPVTQATQAQPVAEVSAKPQAKAAQAKPEAAAGWHFLTSSDPAAMQEARETPAQTAKEANSGDVQARMLQTRQAAAKPAAK